MHDRVCPPRRMRFSFESRCRLVSLIVDGMSPQAAAAACGASRATGYRLWRRYQEGGWAALGDRPPMPRRQPRRLSRELEQRILAAREYAQAGPVIVAAQLGLPASTVWKVLRRYGCSRLAAAAAWTGAPLRARAAGRAPARRHQAARPLLDGRQADPRRRRSTAAGGRAGSTCTSRSTTTPGSPTPSSSPSESPADCVAFLRRAVAWYARARHHRRAGALRQRQRLPLPPLARHLRRARHPPPLHATAPATDQRQGRSARSRHCCANGPTASPTPPAATAPAPSPATSAGTTDDDHTAHSAANHRSAASHRSVGPTSS